MAGRGWTIGGAARLGSRRPSSIALIALLLIALLAAALGFGCVRPTGPSAEPTQGPESHAATTPATVPATVTVPPAPPPAKAPPADRLGGVEVRKYKGKRLDAINSQPETSIKGPQRVKLADYRLAVNGLVNTPLSLTYGQVLALPGYQKRTTLHCVDGWSVTYLWQGVLIKDLLRQASYNPTATIVVFHCYDGYSTSLPLDYVINRNILLAYGMNGRVMPPERGFPFQVVAEDRYGYKWAKWVTRIEVSSDIRFRGHFEKMGADNTATLPGRK